MLPSMRKRRIIILASVIAAVLGGTIWWAARRPPTVSEPIYGGLPLGYWLSPNLLAGSHNTFNLFKVIPSLDSNAVPYLVQVLKSRDGALRRAYNNLWTRLPGWLKKRLPGGPVTIFEDGPQLSFPPVFRFGTSPNGIPRTNAMNITFGPPSSTQARANSCIVLGRLGVDARPAIPELIHCLRADDDPSVRQRAAWALGQIAVGKDEDVVSALAVAAKKDSDPDVKSYAQLALRTMGSEAAAKSGLTNAAAGTLPPTATNSAGVGR